MARQPPILFRGGLSGRIFIVTRYRDYGDGRFEVLEKHDVTEQFDALNATPPATDGGSGE